MNTRRRRRPMKPRADLLRSRPAAPRAPAQSAPFYERLPAKPLTNDRAAAIGYHLAIYQLLEHDAMLDPASASKLKRSDRANLQRLERRWLARASGQDARWNIVGAKSGRAFRELESQYRKKPDPAWEDDPERKSH